MVARMRALVLSIVWVLACFSCTADDLPVQPDFDATKFGGKWYPIQLVMDKGIMKNIRLVGRTATPLDNGDIDMDVEALDKGECTRKITRFLHTDQLGKFTTKAGSIIYIVETDYESYHILLVVTKVNKVLHLDARDPQPSAGIKKRFTALAASMGFPLHKVIKLPRTEPCEQ